MANESTTTTKPTAAQAVAHVKALITECEKHAGKKGVNPFLYINQKLKPALTVLGGKPTEADITEALKLTADVSNFTCKTADGSHDSNVAAKVAGSTIVKPVVP